MRKRMDAILFLGIAVLFTSIGIAQEGNERIIESIQNGQMVDEYVKVTGYVERWKKNPANSTISYIVRDNWGDEITVISNKEHPETKARYEVEGYVVFKPAEKEYQIMEQKRANLDVPTSTPVPPPPTPTQVEVTATPMPLTPTASPTAMAEIAGGSGEMKDEKPVENGFDWVLGLLLAAIIAVIVILIVLLLRGNQDSLAGLDETAVINVADKTQKINAPVAKEEAVQNGTVKMMPGRLEIVGGVELKELRLIRPRGVADTKIKYTFGRLEGDPITHIQLNDPTVSSRQAELRFQENHFILVNIPDPNDPDRNATLYNGRKMEAEESVVLSEGDSIEMGNVKIIYHRS